MRLQNVVVDSACHEHGAGSDTEPADSRRFADLSHEDIAKGVVRGDDSRFEAELYRRFYGRVLAILKARTRGDFAAAEDLAQDTLMTVVLRLREGTINHLDRLAAFVHQTARFKHIVWDRKRSSRRELTIISDDTIEGHRDILLDIEEAEVTARLLALISELSVARDREVLTQYYLLARDKPTICEELELAPDRFDGVIHRARNRLVTLAVRRRLAGSG